MKIGIFGGTFDPIHTAHLQMAYIAMEEYKLDKILFVPCNIPNNGKIDISNPSDRINMLQLSIKDEPRFELDLREVKRGGISYTIDTINEIEQEYKDSALFLIMGYDEIKSFEKWKDYQKIYEKSFLIGFWRGSHDIKENEHYNIDKYCFFMLDKNINISSTEIRDKIKNKKSVKFLLHPEVESYIYEKGLYQ